MKNGNHQRVFHNSCNRGKKRGLAIKINFSNRWLYTFIVLGILAIIGVGVYALTPGVKPNPGHLLSELSPPTGCTADQTIIWDGTNLVCSTGTGSTGLYGICRGGRDTPRCDFQREPAYCSGTTCACRMGYEVVTTGTSDYAIWYSCYKPAR